MMFEIRSVLSDRAWDRARAISAVEPAGGYFDRKRIGRYRLLLGEIQFQRNGTFLFPPEELRAIAERTRALHVEMGDPWYPLPDITEFAGLTASIFDIAYQLVVILDEFRSQPPTHHARLKSLEFSTWADFCAVGDVVELSNGFPEVRLVVPYPEFLDGLQRFLMGFVQAVSDKTPQLLTWESFTELKQFWLNRADSV